MLLLTLLLCHEGHCKPAMPNPACHPPNFSGVVQMISALSRPSRSRISVSPAAQLEAVPLVIHARVFHW